ncbi:ImmA/IrrE family metallo-endopeptidase [Planktothrix mougeotii]|uniref:ImmA/IrrE family metallo-endopeptidase n=1 Tax=Planktothrix mougeotii LEGE 06226 TaxID=1828728 RepID=A0ABR9UEH1_9CYAN|nr:ImmA/IrrE family metallo-endopeptidase [Planktothrix mougeotii]MBE9144864.1 ImmA/IrrE family metallo-endopeptidase [Planktothrix mougeotii LEGE 06226]
MSVIKPYRHLSKQEIEAQAVSILKRVQEKRTRPLKWPLDAGCIAETLGLDMDCGNIPPDQQGEIAAMILPTERKIILNERSVVMSKGFEESCIAHEIGHWELHIDHNQLHQQQASFLCRAINNLQGIEWQAQYFASCLLMPTFKLEEAKKGRNLTKWPHLYAIKDELGVTISNLTHRLQQLEWIKIPKGTKEIYRGNAYPE